MAFSSVPCLSPSAARGTVPAGAALGVDRWLPGVLLLMSESLEIYCRIEKHGCVEKKVKSPNLSFLA